MSTKRGSVDMYSDQLSNDRWETAPKVRNTEDSTRAFDFKLRSGTFIFVYRWMVDFHMEKTITFQNEICVHGNILIDDFGCFLWNQAITRLIMTSLNRVVTVMYFLRAWQYL